MKLRLAFIPLVCVAAVLPPKPPRRHPPVTQTTQGAGAAALIAKVLAVVPVARTNVFVWRYPPSVVPSQYWWNIESSTDLKTWAVVVSNATGIVDVTVNRAEQERVYRLSGKTNP